MCLGSVSLCGRSDVWNTTIELVFRWGYATFPYASLTKLRFACASLALRLRFACAALRKGAFMPATSHVYYLKLQQNPFASFGMASSFCCAPLRYFKSCSFHTPVWHHSASTCHPSFSLSKRRHPWALPPALSAIVCLSWSVDVPGFSGCAGAWCAKYH